VKYTSAEPFTPKFVKDHLTKPGKSTTKRLSSSRAQALYDERVRRRQLGLAGRSGQKEKKKGAVVVKGEKMGRREAAEKGIWRLREEEARCVARRVFFLFLREVLIFLAFRWDAFVPLHRLWLGYMSELLGLVTMEAQAHAQGQGQGRTAPAMKAAMPMAAGMHAKLVKADFHGSIMTGQSILSLRRVIILLIVGHDDRHTVRRSKNAALVGASGIVVQETENTFKVVTRKDKLKGALSVSSLCLFYVHPL
jgi:ribonuclease P protein subunit POP4